MTSKQRDRSEVFSPITVHRTFQTIIDRIVDAIDEEGLTTGDRLPNERELAEMLVVSRSTLRQALRVLESSGVVTIRPGNSGGIFVASEMIPNDVLGQQIAHETHQIAELVTARRLIEPVVYHLTAENASEEDFDRIRDAIALMGKHKHAPQMVLRADGLYHRRIAYATGNQSLRRIMNTIYRDLYPLRSALGLNAERAEHMMDVHNRQLDAMRRRDHALLDKVLDETFIDLELEFAVELPFNMHCKMR
jgi:GntR family transcriptional regulator, transcriptional repressor for pyruvate dehydrogenase complex